jgi:hypothetical protein
MPDGLLDIDDIYFMSVVLVHTVNTVTHAIPVHAHDPFIELVH